MSQTPSGGGGNSALGYGLDPSFSQIEAVGEIKKRYTAVGTTRKDQAYRFSHPWTDAGNLRNALGVPQRPA